MKPTAKLLSLTPVLVLSMACGGMSPMAPDVPSETDVLSASAQSGSTKGISPRLCAWIASVDLQIVPATSLASSVVVEATYQGGSPGSDERCPAPKWSSKPAKAVTPIGNGFSARVDLAQMNGAPLVIATAPNGAMGKIEIPVSGRMGPSARGCAVSAVELQVLPLPTRSSPVIIEATYVMVGPSESRCAAPQWGASEPGILVPVKNAYRIGVDPKMVSGKAEVWATAPNGVTGSIVVVAP